jgi:hypothetical protein
MTAIRCGNARILVEEIMSIQRGIIIGCLALATGACAGNRPAGPQVGREAPGREITVENWTGTDLQVYVLYGGDYTMLGRVRALGSKVLRLPDAAGGEVRLVTQPIGVWETHHLSEPIHVAFDQRVTWQLRATGGSSVTYQPTALRDPDRIGRAHSSGVARRR